MWIWLDDTRPAPAGWTWAKTAAQAIELLNSGQEVYNISLDHDLGDQSIPEQTGYTVACYLEERVHTQPGYQAPTMRVHSANPVGRKRIQDVIDRIGDYYSRNP